MHLLLTHRVSYVCVFEVIKLDVQIRPVFADYIRIAIYM